MLNCIKNDVETKTTGTDIDKIMHPVSRFGGGRATKKQGVIARLLVYFEKFYGIGVSESFIESDKAVD